MLKLVLSANSFKCFSPSLYLFLAKKNLGDSGKHGTRKIDETPMSPIAKVNPRQSGTLKAQIMRNKMFLEYNILEYNLY